MYDMEFFHDVMTLPLNMKLCCDIVTALVVTIVILMYMYV